MDHETTMPFQTPKFENSHCEFFTACGVVGPEDHALREWLNEQPSREIRYRAKDQMAYLHVMSGGEMGFHVHCDVATAAYFGKRKKPIPKDKRRDIQQFFGHISGNSIDAVLIARYRFPAVTFPNTHLVQLLKSLEHTSDDGKTRLRTLGVELTTEGEEIERVKCYLDEEEVRAELRMAFSTEIDDVYLEKVLIHIDNSLLAVFTQDTNE